MFENTKRVLHEKIINLVFKPPEIETGPAVINEECFQRVMAPIIEKKIDGYIKDNEFILMEANEQERDVLLNLIEQHSLSSTALRLTDEEAQKAYDGKTVTVVKFGEEQGKYTQSADYNVEKIDGTPTDLRVRVVKLIPSNLRHVERLGLHPAKVQQMYDTGMFPDDKVDVLKVRMIDA